VNKSYIFPPLIRSFPVRILKDPQSGKWEARQEDVVEDLADHLADAVLDTAKAITA
jgi:hypothetical protein